MLSRERKPAGRGACLAGLTMQSHADPVGLGAIVDDAFLEPRMLQRLFGGDALLGIVDKDLSQQVEELPVEGGVDGDELLQYKCPGQSRSKEWPAILSRSNLQPVLSWRAHICARPEWSRDSASRVCSG